ncbi:hypothetical protein DWB85_17005 [Seongchinamella sediminis]|uniref:Neuromedin U n=1 Tax=Seongchinamella sediminis TaxID=2283635 RepID=A0A3L7DWB3_9GAMM|nr:hypothetical protein [Seongchinamella sediminis]RLQ20523.1 hypothetical protein DWB85_17005 [Seongchinamella sediminis]
MKRHTSLLAGLAFALTGSGLSAQEEQSNEEIARELANPNTTLGTLNFNLDYTSYKGDLPGADGQEAYRVSFQPVLPYPLAEGVNLFVRPNIPVLYKQPIPRVGGADVFPTEDGQFGILSGAFNDSDVELGDIGFDVAIGKTLPSKLVLVGGVVGTLDTATDDAVGLGQYLLGPEAAVAQIFDWGVLGLLVTHQWDVGGNDDFDTSITGGQYFYVVNLSDGWQITGSPTFSYNHEASPGEEKWTLPVGVGFSKTTRFGKTPWKLSLQYWQFVKQADSLGPDFQIRFSLGPVVPLPW